MSPARFACVATLLATPSVEAASFAFRNATTEVGISFVHVTGATGEKFMVETMGSGVVLFDYDGDADPDVFFVNGGSLPGFESRQPVSAGHLYRNDGKGYFEDVTHESGLAHEGYGMGAAAGDYDNDGDVDLYVTHYGPNRLFRNNGDGSFDDVTSHAGVGDTAWGASTAWADLDGDGYLDLYVTNYLNWSFDRHPDCSHRVGDERVRAYCLPDVFQGLPDVLYANNRDGTFRDESRRAGIDRSDGKGLGVVAFDYDEDGDEDLYVANDTVPNFLFRNDGGWKFREVGLVSGVAYDEEGNALAGMGVDVGDYDRDGDLDLFVTNFEGESNTLYRNEANGFFTDVSFRAGVGRASLRQLGFGTVWRDLDNDSWLELVVANGHVLDNTEILREGTAYAQPNDLYRNDGAGGLRLTSDVPGFEARKVSRGAATADIDGDGDLDLFFTNSGAAPDVLLNETEGGRAVRLRLIGKRANRDAAGARLEAEQVFHVATATSYLSQSERVVHVGAGEAADVRDLRIQWPGGTEEHLDPVPVGRTLVVLEGAGVVSSVPLESSR